MARKGKTERTLQRRQLPEDSLLLLLRTRRYPEISVTDVCAQSGGWLLRGKF